MKSLQNKIFIFFVILLLSIQAISFGTIYRTTKDQENQQINHRLNNATAIFETRFESRSYYLAAFAETAAKDFGLKQVFTEDTRSFLVALNNHRKRIDADLAIAINTDKKIIGQLVNHLTDSGTTKVSVGPEHNQQFQYYKWLSQPNKPYLYPLQQQVFQLSLAPLKSGDGIIGWIGFGYAIDKRLAQEFSKLTGLNTGFAIEQQNDWLVLASSYTLTTESNHDENSRVMLQILQHKAARRFISTSHEIGEIQGENLVVVMHGLRAVFLDAIQERWLHLVGLALFTLIISLAGAYIIAAGITKPVKKLVAQAKFIAEGNYGQTVEIDDSGEMGQLAREFHQMQKAVLSREQAITHRAFHDPLTNLPNRNMLMNSLQQIIHLNGTKFCLLLLNIHRIKDVNDTLGHNVGDLVIIEAGSRLKQMTTCELISHIGADEFILLCKFDEQAQIVNFVAQIEAILEPMYCFEGFCMHLQARIGIALYPLHGSDAILLLQKTDTALQQAKKEKQNYQIYDADKDFNTIERLNLIHDLRHAIASNQLRLFYQPKLNLAQNKITHIEALVRWQHPNQGIIPPDNFIPIAEQTGEINALTNWVVTEAIKQYMRWQQLGIDIAIAINVSAENLKNDNFYDFIINGMNNHKIPLNAFTLEITESAVVDDPKSAIALLSKFKQQGLHLSIDDYGTGYSSLAQLKQLPVHELKVDKSFVQKLINDEDDQIIVKSTIELAHNMGLTVVAEGIEDEATLIWLKTHQCDMGQGYFISKPQPADQLTTWLQNRR